jgi:hypothetical protein
MVLSCRSDLATEDAVADDRVEQHQRKNDYTPQNMNMRLDCGAASGMTVRRRVITL